MNSFKKIGIAIIMSLTLILGTSSVLTAEGEKDIPVLIQEMGDHYYVDEPGMLSDYAKEEIDRENKEITENTGVPIIAVLVNSLGEHGNIQDYTYDFLEQWLSAKNLEDSVIIVVAMDVSEVMIQYSEEASYSVSEEDIDKLLHEEIIPYLNEEDFDGGILNGIERINSGMKSSAEDSESKTSEESENEKKNSKSEEDKKGESEKDGPGLSKDKEESKSKMDREKIKTLKLFIGSIFIFLALIIVVGTIILFRFFLKNKK